MQLKEMREKTQFFGSHNSEVQGKVMAGPTFSDSFTKNVSPSSAPIDSGLYFIAGSPLW